MMQDVDKAIESAVYEMVDGLGQNKDLATKILSWMDAIHSGRESLGDRANVAERIELLLNGTQE